jgi:hypothetical protein
MRYIGDDRLRCGNCGLIASADMGFGLQIEERGDGLELGLEA